MILKDCRDYSRKRCLLAVYLLTPNKTTEHGICSYELEVASKDIAEIMSISRPSVHVLLDEAAAKAASMMERLGIAHLKDACPSELSGGEKRRMSIIRALVSGAEVILADEPTGDLDDENTEIVLSLLREAADRGAAVLLVTHEKSAKKWADSVLTMHSGRIEAAECQKEA